MSMDSQSLLQETERYVIHFFATRISPAFLFHNIDHTKDVVKAATLLADYYQLPPDDRLVLLLAAWFHDTGYSSGSARWHEKVSREIANEFLQQHQADPATIEKVGNCIMATQWPQCPTNLTEQILCDADLFHLGTDQFDEKNKQLRKELNTLFGKKLSKKEWRERNVLFLQQHRYFTDYARKHLQPAKQQHLQELIDKDKDGNQQEEAPTINKAMAAKPGEVSTQAQAQAAEPKANKEKAGRTERGIATMFRIMSENHVNLSQMADSKANIMISVNTIVMSIMVSVLLGKLQFYPEYIVPTIILLLVCLSAIVYAILATRPNITKGTFTEEDIKNKKVNLLFFGNFYNMSLQEYDWAMKEMMKDNEYLNSSMVKDIYFLGVVLARKYKYLRISYNIFMFGLILAILAFAIAFFFSEQNIPAS